ncbi:MAG: hypothetical protein NZM09_02980 [Ignavibacterium sp.]|nr:hypothetical protein [Ignavibacterium sp.]MCX7611163.1 hypothetical protein [Ignavibacterium sp.]MDW8374641.1 hypothetical protein [Ignavibacteriales bacterium]
MKLKFIILVLMLILCIFFVTLDKSEGMRRLALSIINPYSPLEASEKTNINSEEKVWKDPRGLFPIFAFNLPDSSKNLSESLRIIERCGINIIINGNYSWMPNPYKIKDAFEKLGQTNLKWLVVLENECKDDFVYCNSNDKTNKNITDLLKTFNKSFVYGYYIWDEPGRNIQYCSPFNLKPNDDFVDINRMSIQIRADSSLNDKLDFVNLFPTYWEGTKTFQDYEKYIDAFINSMTFKPQVLCFDHYPFLKEEFGGFRKDFFANLEIIRKKSYQYNIPFWMIILSSEHLDYKNLTFEEISFQAYSALAYGAKGIGYYIFSKSWEHYGYRSWIFEKNFDDSSLPDSLYGELFPSVKNLNFRIQSIGKFLIDKYNYDIIHLSNGPNNQNMIQPKFISNDSLFVIDKDFSDKDVFAGLFGDENEASKKYILLVNKNFELKRKIYLRLKKNAEIKKFNPSEGKYIYLKKANEILIEIPPASGELFEFKFDDFK